MSLILYKNSKNCLVVTCIYKITLALEKNNNNTKDELNNSLKIAKI